MVQEQLASANRIETELKQLTSLLVQLDGTNSRGPRDSVGWALNFIPDEMLEHFREECLRFTTDRMNSLTTEFAAL